MKLKFGDNSEKATPTNMQQILLGRVNKYTFSSIDPGFILGTILSLQEEIKNSVKFKCGTTRIKYVIFIFSYCHPF